MSVRKRLWFTNKVIRARAARFDPPDFDLARRELNDYLRRAKGGDAEAKAILKDFPPNESWTVDYFDGEGLRRSEAFPTQREAKERHDHVRVDVRKGMHVPISKSPTVGEAAEIWIKRVEADGRERTTVRQYRQHIAHLKPKIGSVKVAKLSVARVEALRDELLKAMSRPLARKVLTSFKSILKAVGQSHVAAGVSVRRDRRQERRLEVGRDIPDPREVKRLIEKATDLRLRTLLLTVSLTGLRASELRGLRWRDVDLKGARLHVRQRADRYNAIGAPKSEGSVRSIRLAPEALAALREWKLKCPKGDLDLVFPTSTGAIEHHANMLRSLTPAMKAAGLVDAKDEPKYGLHSFRHFFASWCIERGVQPKRVQELLGHSSILMTMDVYSHLFPDGDDGEELATASRALLA